MKRTTRRSRLAVASVFSAMLLLDADLARAQYGFSWAATGSTGVVDEADLSEVVFDSVGVALRSTTPAQTTAVIRYPVDTNSFGPYTMRIVRVVLEWRSPATVTSSRADDADTLCAKDRVEATHGF